MDKNIKTAIDNMTYEQMLRKWRFAPVGDPAFQGEAGEYFSMVMKKKKDELPRWEQVETSKKVGWQ